MIKKDLPQFKCHCSAIGQIMKNDRSGKGMGETAKTYLKTWVKEQIYGVRKDAYSKAMDKGIQCELGAIDYAAEVLKWGMVFKNDEMFSNEWLVGTPDLILPDRIIDIKCPWDCFTFPLFDDIPEEYFYQIQGYLDLTGKDLGEVVYVLMNTPEDLVFGEPEDYSNVPAEYRVKSFRVERDQSCIDAIHDRVELCREYVKMLTT